MSEFTVYSIPGSPFGRAVLATLEEKAATYRLMPVAPGTFRSPEHLARHPFGRVPVLEHNGFSLYESQAILRYLDRALPAPALTPGDCKAAARMDQAMNVNDWYLFQGVANHATMLACGGLTEGVRTMRRRRRCCTAYRTHDALRI